MGVLFKKGDIDNTPELMRSKKPLGVFALPNNLSIQPIRLKCSLMAAVRKINKNMLKTDSLEKASNKSLVRMMPDNKKIKTAEKNKYEGLILSNKSNTINRMVTTSTMICCI